jgi:hypothetical protein
MPSHDQRRHRWRSTAVAGILIAAGMTGVFPMTTYEPGAVADGHADPSTTKLYDRRGHNPEKSAAFFATY